MSKNPKQLKLNARRAGKASQLRQLSSDLIELPELPENNSQLLIDVIRMEIAKALMIPNEYFSSEDLEKVERLNDADFRKLHLNEWVAPEHGEMCSCLDCKEFRKSMK